MSYPESATLVSSCHSRSSASNLGRYPSGLPLLGHSPRVASPCASNSRHAFERSSKSPRQIAHSRWHSLSSSQPSSTEQKSSKPSSVPSAGRHRRARINLAASRTLGSRIDSMSASDSADSSPSHSPQSERISSARAVARCATPTGSTRCSSGSKLASRSDGCMPSNTDSGRSSKSMMSRPSLASCVRSSSKAGLAISAESSSSSSPSSSSPSSTGSSSAPSSRS
mmetsp:Transcript_41679/g.109932  ORF Transcript_41679/g.109932 Transcript_41679/m.109932 type:complete len:225 (-) Transcript_41679:74-748(-)